jgi:hypothetical protein
MGLMAWIDRLLSKGNEPTAPARSVFGADAERSRAERAATDELEFEVEREKGRPRGG